MLAKGNIFGETFPEKIRDQIEVREYIHGQGLLDTTEAGVPTAAAQFTGTRMEQLRYLHSNTSWLKLVSSVDVKSTARFRKTTLQNAKNIGDSGLAKLNVLFGGVKSSGEGIRGGLQLAGENIGIGKPGNDNYGYPIFPKTDAYGFGGVESGIRPMPGILSATVEHLSNGTLRRATIKIKAYNRTQFEIIDTLYLRLGYSMLLEWGHTIMAQGKAPNDIKYNTNPDVYSLENDFLGGKKNYQQILDTIRQNRETSEGNYDGFLGRVVNFTWEFKPDGTYDITVFAISVGDVIESINLNSTTLATSGSATTTARTPYEVIGTYKDKHDLGAFLADQAQAVNAAAGGLGVAARIADPYDSTVFGAGSYRFWQGANTVEYSTDLYRFEYYIRFGTLLEWLEKSKLLTVGGANPRPCLNIDYDIDSNLIQLDRFTAPCDPSVCIFQRPGYTLYKRPPKQIIGYKTETIKDYVVVKENATKDDLDILNYQQNRTADSVTGDSWLSIFEAIGILIDEIKYAFTGRDEFVYDAATKQIRVLTGGTREVTTPIYDDPKATLTAVDLFTNLARKDRPRTQFFLDSKKYPNVGRLMNVFFNMTYLLRTFDSLIDNETGKVSLLDFLQTICEGFCSTTGGYNKLTVFIDEDTNTVKIIDKVGVDKRGQIINSLGGPTKLAKFNIYGFKQAYKNYNQVEVRDYYTGNFIQNFQIRTELTKETSAMIAISAAAQGQNILGENSTAFSVWNQGLEDRILKYFNNPKAGTDPVEYKKKIIAEKMAVFNQFIESIQDSNVFEGDFELSPTWNESGFSTYSNAAHTLVLNNTNAEALSKGTQNPGTGFLPLKVSLTMKGMSGMKILQEFKIQSDFLPSNYPQALRFLVMNIKHELTNNQWTTTLETISAPESAVAQEEEGDRRKPDRNRKAQQNTGATKPCPPAPNYSTPGILTISRLPKEMMEGLDKFTAGNPGLRALAGGIVVREGGAKKTSVQYKNNNPGNLKSGKLLKFNTMEEGWAAMIDRIIKPWVQGTKPALRYPSGTQYPNCHKDLDNQYFKQHNIPYSEQESYGYVSGSPTLRQFVNVYAPLSEARTDSPPNYAAQLYKTLIANGVGITSIDEPMSNYIKV